MAALKDLGKIGLLLSGKRIFPLPFFLYIPILTDFRMYKNG